MKITLHFLKICCMVILFAPGGIFGAARNGKPNNH